MKTTFARTLFFYLFSSLSLFAAVDPKEKLASVYVERAEKVEIADTFIYPAQVESKVHAKILSETDGVVQRVAVRLGQAVRKNQILFIIRHTDPIFNYAEVRVTAPVRGKMSCLDVTEGTLVTKGQSLGSVMDPKQMQIKAEVPASDLSRLRSGLKASFSSPALQSTLSLSIDGISPAVDAMTGTATSIFKIDTDSSNLTPGLVGKVEIRLNSRRTFVVPESAIVYRENQKVLRIVEEDKILQIPVVLGDERRGQFEILDGLKEGMLVVERASRFVQDGEKVTLISSSKMKPGIKTE